jgi:hypothetical protein
MTWWIRRGKSPTGWKHCTAHYVPPQTDPNSMMPCACECHVEERVLKLQTTDVAAKSAAQWRRMHQVRMTSSCKHDMVPLAFEFWTYAGRVETTSVPR